MNWYDRLREPADARGLAVFRMLFGATMCVGALRFLWNGWVDRFFVQPRYMFSFWGFDWLSVASPGVMHGIFWAMAIAALAVAVGLFYRVAIVAFFLLFTYVELLDVTNYLNHYVLASMIAGILIFLPAHTTWSLDARLRPGLRRTTVPRLCYGWLRFQVGAVWVSAAIAKMTTDWLVHAQPLNIWLNARTDTPVIGQFLDIWEVALAASWAGMLYDLTIPFLLLWKRTRPAAFVAVLVFHVMTHVWFNIGMFPLIMVVCATVFLAPDWPARFAGQAVKADSPRSVKWPVYVLAAVWCAVLTVLPLRFLAYEGNVLWHEQGMRWAFKVLCREKNGTVTYRVHLPAENRTVQWSPHTWLTPYQAREFAGQPDMILRFAHDLEADYAKRGHGDVAIFADAIVSLNGRRPAPLIDPSVDLTTVHDGVQNADWILPAPTEPPPHLGRKPYISPLFAGR